MSVHEAKGLIKPIKKFVLLNMLLGLSFFAHSHPIQDKLAQAQLHIYPPISVVEGCKDLGYESWKSHISVCWDNQFLKKLRKYLQKHYKNQIQFAIMLVSSLYNSTCTLSQSLSHLDRLLWIESRGSKAIIPGFMWKLSCFWCTMEIIQDLLLAWTRIWYHVEFVNHWSIGKWEKLWSRIMQWNIKNNVYWTRQTWDKYVKN